MAHKRIMVMGFIKYAPKMTNRFRLKAGPAPAGRSGWSETAETLKSSVGILIFQKAAIAKKFAIAGTRRMFHSTAR